MSDAAAKVTPLPAKKETQIIAIYGKGGIGKSFTLANLSHMMAEQGKLMEEIDRDKKTVSIVNLDTSEQQKLPYDKLVLSPGIDFVDGAVPGWDLSAQNKMPHAYKAGSQTELLKAQLESMPEGGRFAMVAPPNAPTRMPTSVMPI